jgi:hypothetical protein
MGVRPVTWLHPRPPKPPRYPVSTASQLLVAAAWLLGASVSHTARHGTAGYFPTAQT